MVSASKLRRAQEAQINAKQYAQHTTALISRLAASVESASHPLLTPKKEIKRVHILIITSDKGLCGAFNQNANKMVTAWLRENRHERNVEISCCGKKGFMHFRRRETMRKNYDNVTIKPNFAQAKTIGEDLTKGFIGGEHDEVYLTYNQFFSPISQKTVFEKILPIDPEALLKEKVKHRRDYLFEPEAASLLEFLVPHFLYFKIYFALLENSAGEHGARMSAMDNASNNAADLIDRYTLYRNRARQAQITTELTEIVAGAEAIK